MYLRGGSWVAPCIPGAVQVPFLDTCRLIEWIRPGHSFCERLRGYFDQRSRWRVAYLARMEGSLLTLRGLVLGWLSPGRPSALALHGVFSSACSLRTSLATSLCALRSRALASRWSGKVASTCFHLATRRLGVSPCKKSGRETLAGDSGVSFDRLLSSFISTSFLLGGGAGFLSSIVRVEGIVLRIERLLRALFSFPYLFSCEYLFNCEYL